MIHIDDRTGSAELLPLFHSHRSYPSPPSSLRRLPSADFCFSGNGPSGPTMIGIERKRIRHRRREDLLQFRDLIASVTTGRLMGEQVPKLLDHYEFSYILIEGLIKTDTSTGHLLAWGYGNRQTNGWEVVKQGKEPFMAARLWNALESVTWNTAIRVLHVADERQTVEEVLRLYRYFNDKEWGQHHAHVAIHRPEGAVGIGKASTVRRVAHTLRGVGWEKSAVVDGRFKSVEDMVNAEPEDWGKLEGFGKVLSKRVWEELHGVHGGGGEGEEIG
jgi:ERCC4-type nuclease